MTVNLQQSTMIEWLNPNDLKTHSFNQKIYGDDGFQDLVGSIKEHGILQAIYCLADNTIVSGHRRWRAAIQAGLTSVPTIRVSYSSELETRQAIIEHNRYRVKTGEILYREGKELEIIESDKAELREKTGKKIDPVENLPQGKTRDIVAETIGLGSGKQWDKLKYVAENAPELLNKINNTKGRDLSVHAAFVTTKRLEMHKRSKEKLDYAFEHPEEVPVGESTDYKTPGGWRVRQTITDEFRGLPITRTSCVDPTYHMLKDMEPGDSGKMSFDLQQAVTGLYFARLGVDRCLKKYKGNIENLWWADSNWGIGTVAQGLVVGLSQIKSALENFEKQFEQPFEFHQFKELTESIETSEELKASDLILGDKVIKTDEKLPRDGWSTWGLEVEEPA